MKNPMLKRTFLLLSFWLIFLLPTLETRAQVAPPSGVIGWWAGDGDGRDLSGNALHGALFNGGTYAIDRVGQGFDFRVGNTTSPSHLRVPDNPLLKPAQFTIEAWVRFTPTFDNYAVVIAKGYASGFNDSYALGTSPNVANPQFFTAHNGLTHQLNAPTNLPNPNSWNHLAASYDGVTKRLYVNGSLVTSGVVTAPISYDVNPAPLTVGADFENSIPYYFFNGFVDEATLYNRSLSDMEIQSIFNAGVGGKIKSAATATGANSQSNVGDQTITFQNVTTAGTTSSYSLNPASLPALPMGSTHTGLAYEISTTAIYQQGAADDVRVCFNVPALSAMNFANYRVFHLEAGNWVNRTLTGSAYPNLCSDNLTSLSPFAIVNAPTTAANVAVGGRVMTTDGRGVSRARLTLTDASGNTRNALTNAFGYYRFDEVEAGQTYVVSVSHKRYQFAPQVVSVSEDLSELDFTAEP